MIPVDGDNVRRETVLIGDVLDVRNLRLQICDASSIIEEYHGEDCDDDERDEETGDDSTAARLIQLLRFLVERRHRNVAFVAGEAVSADATVRRMTLKVVALAVARFHAVIIVISFRTNI